MYVQRVYESPRVTKPYTDEQWGRIAALGHAVDADLRDHDVRLTMGGEPTFVSTDDRDGDEWNTDSARPDQASARRPTCCGSLKKRFDAERLRALRPGQVVPPASSCRAGRWAATGAPTVSRRGTTRRCLPTKRKTSRRRRGAGRTRSSAHWRRELWCSRTSYVQPGYEDVCYYLWRERRLPDQRRSVRRALWTTKSNATDCARVFMHGLDATVGYALPLQRSRRHISAVAQRPVVSAW